MNLSLLQTTTGVITVLGACGSANAFMTPPTTPVSALIKPSTTTERTTKFPVLPLAPHNSLRSPRPAGTTLLSALNDDTKPSNTAPIDQAAGADRLTSPNSAKAVTLCA